LTVGDDLEPQHLSRGVSYLLCRCDDVSDTTLLPNFDVFHEFIRCAREANSSVLVHCLAGISRSATTVASFMMKEDGATFEATMRRIREHRVYVSPNVGFERQLRSYEHVTTGNEEARANYDKFRCKAAPAVELANGVEKRKVTTPAEVREFLAQVAAEPPIPSETADVASSAAVVEPKEEKEIPIGLAGKVDDAVEWVDGQEP
jgi:hypothetical protein